MTNKSPVSDEILTAYLDGEIPDGKHEAITALIAQDENLQRRLKSLQVEFGSLAEAFQQIKVPDLNKQVSAIHSAAARKQKPAFWPTSKTAIAASVLVATFVAGFIAADLSPFGKSAVPAKVAVVKKPGWRQSVANYVSLYTADTISRVSASPEIQHKNLALLSHDVGLSLTSEILAINGLDYKRGLILDLRGKPLVQLAYLNQNKTPVAFCIIRSDKGKKSMQFETRNGLQVGHWASDSHGFMVIGDVPMEEMVKLAKSFSVRF